MFEQKIRIFLSSSTAGHESAVFSKKFKNFFLHFATEELSSVFSTELNIFLNLLPISEKSTRIEPPFAQKGAEDFLSSHFTTEEIEVVLAKNQNKYFPSSHQSIWTGMGVLAENF